MAQMYPVDPHHPITCSHPPARARALFQGHLLADSAHTLLLREAGHPDRVYFPRADVEMEVLVRNDQKTYCPHKGQASWFTINRDGKIVENVGWSYETPLPAMAEIAGMLSFDLDKVEIEADAAGVSSAARAMSDYIRHTDSGSGVSQAEHWAPTVGRPDEIDDEDEERPLPH